MSAAPSQAVVIACPHCRTRYQVAPDTIGKGGRQVACAHCGKTWKAKVLPPEPTAPEPTSPDDEADLDAAFLSEEERMLASLPPRLRQMIPKGEKPSAEMLKTIAEIQAAIEPRESPSSDETTVLEPNAVPTPAGMRAAIQAFAQRQRQVAQNLPMARVRRMVRHVTVGLVAATIGGLVLLRQPVVTAFPDLASLYAALGLPVNVVGLEIDDVDTLLSRRNGGNVIQVEARVRSVADRAVRVPNIVVTLMDRAGAELYQWSVLPRVGELEPGESLPIATELPGPPLDAAQVRLTFATGTAAQPI